MSSSTHSYPRQLRANKEYRARLLKEASGNKDMQEALMEKCRRDIVFWFNIFAWTYDPRLKGDKSIPFVLYSFQEDFVKELHGAIRGAESGDTFGVEKCRDMGVTWMVLGVFFWFWLFEENADFLVGSRKEEFVDKKRHPDTLFGKLDILLKKIPAWMRPESFDRNRDSVHMVLSNPDTGSLIKGESSNSDFSRSGRYKAVLMDELAFWNNASSAYSAASESCNLIVPVSTPNPEGSGFFKYLVDNKDRYSFTRLEHTLHPLKTAAWLKEQYEKKSPEVIAVEIMMDYMGALKGKVYARAMRCPVKDEYDYDPSFPLYRSWDYGHGGDDPTVVLWFQKDPATGWVRLIDWYSKGEEDIHYFSPIALGARALKSGVVYPENERADMDRRELWNDAEDFGDPYSANTRTFVGQTTIAKEQEKDGINVKTNTKSTVPERIEKGRMLMKRLLVHPRCLPVLEMLSMARFPSRAENSQATTAKSSPVHDHTSHVRTAFEYFADNEPEDMGPPKAKTMRMSKYQPRGVPSAW